MRIVLQYREQPFQSLWAIINTFFEWWDIQPLEDYRIHICSYPPSSKLYIVLDVHCKTCPDVELSKLKLKIFKVPYRAHGRRSKKDKAKGQQYLIVAEEKALAQYVKRIAVLRYSIPIKHLCSLAFSIARRRSVANVNAIVKDSYNSMTETLCKQGKEGDIEV